MINLLPDDRKQNIRAARMNVLLLRYNILTLATIAFIAVICAGFYFVLQTQRTNALATSTNNSNQESSLSSVSQEAHDYQENLAVAKQVLNNSVSYTDVIIAITKLIPPGVVLDDIDLTAASFGQQMTFTAHATDYASAVKLKQNFQTSKIFSNAYFQTLGNSNGASNGVTGKYPISISLSAKLAAAGTF